MSDLSLYFANPFHDRNINLAALLAFTTDHLQRLAANDPGGIFAARRAATTAAWQAVSDAFTEDQTKLGLRKARKQSIRKFRKALAGGIAKINVAVKAQFGERSPELTEIFPGGRRRFARCPDDSLESHLAALSRGLTAHAAELAAAVVAQAEALRMDWQAVYQASEMSSGVKAAAAASRRNARRALQGELYLNLLALAQQFPEEPAKLGRFMQPSLLKPHRHAPPAPRTAPAGG